MIESDLLNWAVMIGLAIGAVFSYLFVPFTGEQTPDDRIESLNKIMNDRREALKLLVKRLEEEFGELNRNVEERLLMPGSREENLND